MRWDRLFEALEASAADAAADERDALAEELGHEQWGTVRWLDLLGGAESIEVAGHGAVPGRVRYAGDLVVVEGSGPWVAIVPEAIVAVSSVDGRAVPAPTMRRDRREFVRLIMADGGPVRVVRRDGTVLVGPVVAAGVDFLQVQVGSRRISLPWRSVATLSPQ